MSRFEIGVTIERPVGVVFSQLANIQKYSLWQWQVEPVQPTGDGAANTGARFRYVYRFMGRRSEAAGEIMTYDPSGTFACRIEADGFRQTQTYTLRFDGIHTQVHLTVDTEVGGIWILAKPLLIKRLKSQAETNLHNLKGLLEARPDYEA